MAEIYNPWQQPTTDNDISFAATELYEGDESAEHEHESVDASEDDMLAEALSVIDSQSRTIQKLLALLTGDQQDGNN